MAGLGILGFGVSMFMDRHTGGESMNGAIEGVLAEGVIFVGLLVSGISAGVAYATSKRKTRDADQDER